MTTVMFLLIVGTVWLAPHTPPNRACIYGSVLILTGAIFFLMEVFFKP